MGSLDFPGGTEAHAIALVRRGKEPAGLSYYFLSEVTTFEGDPVPAGYYVPIDYEVVGGISNAVGRGWKLERLYTPEKIYGSGM